MVILTQANANAIPLRDDSVHCVMTSPPYLWMRDYKVGVASGELGQETFADCLGWATGRPCGQCHVCHLVNVFRDVRRVLHPSGVAWLNYGDLYAQSAPRGRYGDQGDLSTGDHGELGPQRDLSKLPKGVKKGDKLLMHARVALALQADGWWVRSAPVWHKTNPIPQPSQQYRRPVDSYEMVYLLAKSYKYYYYDAYAVQEDAPTDGYAKRHLRDVWAIPAQGWKGAHFAAFPEDLVRPCILASTSEHGVCSKCKAPYKRITERDEPVARPDNPNPVRPYTAESGHGHGTGATTLHKMVNVRTIGWEPTCDCPAGVEPAMVLDIFAGSGTTCKVARDLGRSSVGLDISLTYLREEAGARLVTFNGRRPRLGQLRQKKVSQPMADLPLFGGT